MRPDHGSDKGNWRRSSVVMTCHNFTSSTRSVRSRLWWQSSPPPLKGVSPHNFSHHPNSKTFLEPTELTPIPSPFIHRAVSIRHADIFGAALDCPLKKAFASFTSSDTIMLAGCSVSADSAHFLCRRGLDVHWVNQRLFFSACTASIKQMIRCSISNTFDYSSK